MTGEYLSELLDAKAFAGVVAGQEQGDVVGFRFQAGVKAGLARDEQLAARAYRWFEKRSATAAGHGGDLDLNVKFADDLYACDA